MNGEHLEVLLRMLRGIFTGPGRPLALNRVGGVLVSTVVTTDLEKPETAVMGRDHTCPVERYETEEEALEGHRRWVERMREQPTSITMLGYGGVIPAEEVELVYDEDWAASKMAEQEQLRMAHLENKESP